MAVAEAALKETRPRVPMPALVAAAAAALYLACPAARFNFDGVACAIAVELGDAKHLAHGNHLAYGVLGLAWFKALQFAGYPGRAILALQALSALLSAAAAGAFASFLKRAGLAKPLAAGAALGLAVSGVYWTWALEAQVYPLGALFLFLAAREAVIDRPDPRRLGLLIAGAALGHAGHVMFLPAALWSIKDWRSRRRCVVWMGAALAAAYLLCGVFLVRPQNLDELRTWLLGSAALNVEKKFLWHGGYSGLGLKQWAAHTLDLLGAGPFVGGAAILFASWAGWGERHLKASRIAALWIVSYAALYLAWEPFTPVYRITDTAPLWLFLALAFERLPLEWAYAGMGLRRLHRARVGALAACALWLAFWNLSTRIGPGGKPSNNAALRRAQWLARETPQNAWILADSIDQVYIPYFAGRRPLNVKYFTPETASTRLALIWARHEPVYAVPETLQPEWREWVASRRPEQRAWTGEWNLFLIH